MCTMCICVEEERSLAPFLSARSEIGGCADTLAEFNYVTKVLSGGDQSLVSYTTVVLGGDCAW